MSDNWDNKDLPSEGMKAKVKRKYHAFLFTWTADARSTFKVLFILYFVSDSESESESESEPESESEQSHHDSAPLHVSTYVLERYDSFPKAHAWAQAGITRSLLKAASSPANIFQAPQKKTGDLYLLIR